MYLKREEGHFKKWEEKELKEISIKKILKKQQYL